MTYSDRQKVGSPVRGASQAARSGRERSLRCEHVAHSTRGVSAPGPPPARAAFWTRTGDGHQRVRSARTGTGTGRGIGLAWAPRLGRTSGSGMRTRGTAAEKHTDGCQLPQRAYKSLRPYGSPEQRERDMNLRADRSPPNSNFVVLALVSSLSRPLSLHITMRIGDEWRNDAPRSVFGFTRERRPIFLSGKVERQTPVVKSCTTDTISPRGR